MIADEEHGNDSSRRAIDYLPNFSRYSDRVEEEANESGAERGLQQSVEAGVQRVKNALTSGHDDEEQEHPVAENEWLSR